MGRHGAMNPAGRALGRDTMAPRIGNRWLTHHRPVRSAMLDGPGPPTGRAFGRKWHGSGRQAGRIIRHLEDALAIADEIEDGEAGYLIERALDAARSRLFRLLANKDYLGPHVEKRPPQNQGSSTARHFVRVMSAHWGEA